MKSTSLGTDHLSAYLNDHLAGSVAALELLESIGKIPGLESFAGRMQQAIEEDRVQLDLLMKSLSVSHSAVRRTASWVAEKLAELKIALEDGKGPFYQLELLEALALGIEGKRALWSALAASAELDPALRGFDYESLIARASDQRAHVESLRLKAAVNALATNIP